MRPLGPPPTWLTNPNRTTSLPVSSPHFLSKEPRGILFNRLVSFFPPVTAHRCHRPQREQRKTRPLPPHTPSCDLAPPLYCDSALPPRTSLHAVTSCQPAEHELTTDQLLLIPSVQKIHSVQLINSVQLVHSFLLNHLADSLGLAETHRLNDPLGSADRLRSSDPLF